MPHKERYLEFTQGFSPVRITEKKKLERDRAELLVALKELVVRFAMICPYDSGRIPTADKALIMKAERAIERAEAER